MFKNSPGKSSRGRMATAARHFCFSVLLACTAAAFTPECCDGSTIAVFTNYSDWQTAATSKPLPVTLLSESFDGDVVHNSELSLISISGMAGIQEIGNGKVADGRWTDCVGKNGCNGKAYDVTELTLNGDQIYGIWAEWHTTESSDGLEMWIPGGGTALTGAPDPFGGFRPYDGGWGFVSDQPFAQLLLGEDRGSQNFTMDNLVIASTTSPEPAMLLPLGLAVVVSVFRTSRLRAQR